MTMAFNFTNEKVDTGSNTMPGGTLCWGVLTVRGIKNSQETQAEYADCELTVLGGPFENRKLFPVIMNPLDERSKEQARMMGYAAVLHMVEAAQLVNINDPSTYAPLNALAQGDFSAGFRQIMAALDGKAVAFKTSIKKDKNGVFPDKDVVGEWLSPNPTRSSTAFKGYQALAEGKLTMKPAAPGTPQAQGAAAITVSAFGTAAKPAAPVAAASAFSKPAAPAGAPAVGPTAAAPAFLQAPLLQAASSGGTPPAAAPGFPEQRG